MLKNCLKLLTTNIGGRDFSIKKELYTVLFRVATVAKDTVSQIIANLLRVKSEDEPRSYDDAMIVEMLLTECFRCIPVYRLFPDEIIELLKIEWYKSKNAVQYMSDPMVVSFGLPDYPYRYYPLSANQTPIRHLLEYHPKVAIDFIVELMNRSVEHYIKSPYAESNKTKVIVLSLFNEAINQHGDSLLWTAYRGKANVPNLIQCVLMASKITCLIEQVKNFFERRFYICIKGVQFCHANVCIGVNCTSLSLGLWQ